MSEVKRYDLVGDMDGNCNLNEARMELSDDGVYVNHRDYEALQAKCASLASENSILNLSRAVLSENILEACNAIASSGFRNKAIMKGFYASTGNGNKYPNPISTMVDEALSELSIPATDAFLVEIERKAIRKFINSIEHILRDKLSPYDTEEMIEAMRIFLEEQGGK